ncbi:MAG TPA: hypothetical protein VLV49_03195 [Terriglobales bacterium]|nr:hypothetical protein [Terriglobales bacterium]
MSIAGIASTLFSQLSSLQNSQTQPLSTEFQQLAQDLQSGNLTQAQADYSALQQNLPAGFSSSNSPLAQELNAVGSDLQSGNLSSAQQDFAKVEQTVQQSAQLHHHHHHHGAGATQAPQSNPISQLLDTLGQDLQAGNLTQAQQAYSALTQNLQLLGIESTPGADSTALSALSLSA